MAPPVAVAILIFAASSQPVPDTMFTFFMADKIAHFLIFGILASLIYRAWSNGMQNRRLETAFTISTTLTIAYGATDELHQSFIVGRQCEVGDLVADALGTIMFALFCFYRHKLRSRAGFNQKKCGLRQINA